MKKLTIPIDDEAIRSLTVGEAVSLNGVMLTGRDAVHKWMIETFIRKTREPQGDDPRVNDAVQNRVEFFAGEQENREDGQPFQDFLHRRGDQRSGGEFGERVGIRDQVDSRAQGGVDHKRDPGGDHRTPEENSHQQFFRLLLVTV